MPTRLFLNSLFALFLVACAADTDMIIEKTYQLPFPPKQVYDAWVSSETVIAPATAMDINPVIGGHYRLIMKMPDFEGRNEGKFLTVNPGKQVVYTWEWNGDGEVSTIDVTFSQTETGTEIRLSHTGFQKQESVDSHDSGWDSYITGFTAFLEEQ